MDSETRSPSAAGKKIFEKVVVRLCGDSGDGMQLAGTQLASEVALFGNGLATLPDYPAEIRAPVGTLAGVSGFQLQFSSSEVMTPGDKVDVLVAMNPAALKGNLFWLKPGGILLVNLGAFNSVNLKKAGYESTPLEGDSLKGYRVLPVDMNELVLKGLAKESLSKKEILRSRNFFALGLLYWLFNQDKKRQIEFINTKFKKLPEVANANETAFKQGYAYGENTETFQETFQVNKASPKKGLYKSVTGNHALCMGLVAASEKLGLPLFLGSYPITPASDILHELSGYRQFNVKTFQAEDEISAIGAAIGAAFGGSLSLCTTSGPGFALKAEALGFGVMLEMPLVLIDVQRAGPSTGLPTKVEQSDLMMALYGRSGDAPLPVIAPKTPGDCFWAAFEACRIATKYMTPVVLLSDAYLANGAQPFLIPDVSELKASKVQFRTNPDGYRPYARDKENLARAWVVPGTKGMTHRLGGLEKDSESGDISYEPDNHEKMTRLRANKIQGIQKDIGATEIFGDSDGDLLLVGFGSTFGALREATKNLQERGLKVSHVHPRWLNPLPADLEEIVQKFSKVVVCELNDGQLSKVLSAAYGRKLGHYNKIKGQPFFVEEIEELGLKTLEVL